MRKILLTGCHGQLGQALQSLLDDSEVLCTDSDTLDITDRQAVFATAEDFQPQLIINSAAYTRVDDAESDKQTAWQVNADGPGYLAEAAAAVGAEIVQISTDYVFDGSSRQSWLESSPTEPLSVYGKSKLAGEQQVARYNSAHYIVRTAWLYHYSGENFLRTMYRLSDRDEIRVVDDQVGSPTNADDLAVALLQLIDSKQYGIHHLVNSGATSWYGLTCEFYRQLGIDTKVIPVTTDEFPRPAPRPASSVLDTERNTGIVLPSWQDGVAKLVNQIKDQGWS